MDNYGFVYMIRLIEMIDMRCSECELIEFVGRELHLSLLLSNEIRNSFLFALENGTDNSEITEKFFRIESYSDFSIAINDVKFVITDNRSMMSSLRVE